MNNNNEIGDYDLGGTFIFGNVTYSKCSISLNGFIYFGNVGVFYTFNPFADINWKTIAVFAGNTALTSDGINVTTENNICTITFNSYSSFSSKDNVLQYAILLYLNTHTNYPNRIDLKYISSTSQINYFSGDYFIGYCDGTHQKYISNINTQKIYYGGSKISSNNTYPANNTTIENITSIVPSGLLSSAVNSVAMNIYIGGDFIFGNNTYSKCNVSSNGYVYFHGSFDSIPNKNITNPFLNKTWKIIAPFSGYLNTSIDGITTKILNNVFTITFNCFSKQQSEENLLIFSVSIYLNSHSEKPNQVSMQYQQSVSRCLLFLGDYYAGFSNGLTQKTIANSNDLELITGKSHIQTTNIFPNENSAITNITNIISSKLLILSSKMYAVEKEISLGGTFIFGGIEYTSCTISTNGYVYFGKTQSVNITVDSEYVSVKKSKQQSINPTENTANPFSVSGWHILAPFCGHLKTSANGICIEHDIINKKCVITFNCHSTSISNTATIIFSVEICYNDNPTPNKVYFKYLSESSNSFRSKYFIGFSDGFIQKFLYENTDLELIPGNLEIITTNKFPSINTIIDVY